MTEAPFRCSGCGAVVDPARGSRGVLACPQAAAPGDTDHVVERPRLPDRWPLADRSEPDPFVRYRHRLYAHELAIATGLGDDGFVSIARRLNAAIRRVDGRGFVETPFGVEAGLSRALAFDGHGRVWVKNETVGVSGSHKARHLMGIELVLDVLEASGPPRVERLAIASCGNAALAAAVVARAAGRQLDVFVPPSANARVLERLRGLDAHITTCDRRQGEAGDPCYLRFREAIAEGATPFCCQGPDNALTIEGGQTLVYEMLDAMPDTALERVFVQVGGGALASACVRALEEAVAVGRLPRLPRIHAVQTRGGFPLARAYERLRAWMAAVGFEATADAVGDRAALPADVLRHVLHHAATHRSSFMWAWETAPESVAHGILDDETYDWLAVVRGMLASGGAPVVVDEDTLHRANALAVTTTGIDVDHTGSAGLAGLLTLLEEASPALAARVRGEQVAVVFSGRRR